MCTNQYDSKTCTLQLIMTNHVLAPINDTLKGMVQCKYNKVHQSVQLQSEIFQILYMEINVLKYVRPLGLVSRFDNTT